MECCMILKIVCNISTASELGSVQCSQLIMTQLYLSQLMAWCLLLLVHWDDGSMNDTMM